jgi:hypothetical protein
VSDPKQYSTIAAAFIAKFKGDISCKNIDRLFYGNTAAEAVVLGGVLTVDALNEITAGPQLELRETKKIEKDKVANNITYDQAAMMLNVIPGDALPYDDWFRIVSALGNYFSEEEALALVESWAPDEDRGTAYKIKHRASKISIGTLVWFAKRFGFDTSVLHRRNGGNAVGPDGALVHADGAQSPDEIERVILQNSPIEAIKFWIAQRYETRFNVVKCKYEIRSKEDVEFRLLDDRDVNDIWTALKGSAYKLANKYTVRDIIESSFSPEFNPLFHFYYNLPEWDMHNHIHDFTSLVTTEPGQEKRWHRYFMKWFVSMAACALERSENHQCIVLVGPQGVGKSTLIDKLVPPELKEYYAATSIDPKDKYTKSMVSEYFLINLDELETSTKEEVGYLKSLLTDDYVTVRKPFARYILNYKRRASFIGSVNRANFLNDISGSRRWLVTDCVKINYSDEFNLQQMYAQAFWLLNNKLANIPEGFRDVTDKGFFKYWFDGKDIAYIQDFNSRYEILSAEQELLNEHYTPFDCAGLSNDQLRALADAKSIYLLTGTEIFNELQMKTSLRLSTIKLGQFLHKLGFAQMRFRYDGIIKRVYPLKKQDDAAF